VRRPSSHIQWPFTSGLWRGTSRHARSCLWWSSPLQPVAQPWQTDGVASQLPGPHREAEVLRGQRADRADVDGVERVGVVERWPGRRRCRSPRDRRGWSSSSWWCRRPRRRTGCSACTGCSARRRGRCRADVDDLGLADLGDVDPRELRCRGRCSGFCSVHSPALSQIGQSIGWLTSVNSSICLRAAVKTAGLGVHHHALATDLLARRLELRVLLDLDQALPAARRDRQARVVAERRRCPRRPRPPRARWCPWAR
jgi:hypothetical protein